LHDKIWYLRSDAGTIIIYFITVFWQMLGYQDFNAKSKKKLGKECHIKVLLHKGKNPC